jgi:predicted component of type VI protein secretion system
MTTQRSKITLPLIQVLCMSVLLVGCQKMNPFASKSNNPLICLNKIDISLDSNANQDSAVSVDVLVVYKEELLSTIMKMTAKDYFASSMQIKRDYPDMVDIWHWELTPGQLVRDYPITQRSDRPEGAVIFADYFAPGDHRIRFAQQEHAHVRLKKYDFCVLEQGCSGDISHRSITSRGPSENPQTGAMKGGLSKEKPGGDLKSAAADVKKEVSSVKGEISGIKKLFQ